MNTEGRQFADLDLLSIQPTQLFISEQKLRRWMDRLQGTSPGLDAIGSDAAGSDNKESDAGAMEMTEPIPVKRIGNDLFFTDGHTRAFALWKMGFKTVRTIPEPDDLDWISYLANVQWCRQAGIRTIADLAGRVLDQAEYEKRWVNRCSEFQTELTENPLRDLIISPEMDPAGKQAICNEILRALPEWFGIEEAIIAYVRDVGTLPFIAARLYGKVIGFCAYRIHYRMNAELFVLGIFREFHRMGIGARMITAVQTICRSEHIPFMSVKTLSERHPDRNYALTRKFYEKLGFCGIEEFPDLWGESNPCLYMIKKV